MKKRWIKGQEHIAITKCLQKDLSISRLLAKMLAQRGISTTTEAQSFLSPKLSDLNSPFLMKDMQVAVSRIIKAIESGESVLLYGDYDVDGVSSVVMLHRFLSNYTNTLDFYIPDRQTEGYGLSIKGINHAIANDQSLIVVMDCGITAVEEVYYAAMNDVDVIICDHHTPKSRIPDAVAVLNPLQKGCDYPFKYLSGCGVVFKLIRAICIQKEYTDNNWLDLLGYVALATSCDIVPMIGENRILVRAGLKQLEQTPFLGLRCLLEKGNITGRVSVGDLVFKVGPVINATGRLSHAKKSVELLLEKDLSKARQMVEEAIGENTRRKAIERVVTDRAKK